MVWPIVGSRTAKEQNGERQIYQKPCGDDMSLRQVFHISVLTSGFLTKLEQRGNCQTLSKQGNQRTMVTPRKNKELRGEKNNARNNVRCTLARKTTNSLDRQTWIGLPIKESIRITDDRDKWRKYGTGSKYIRHLINITSGSGSTCTAQRLSDQWRCARKCQ